MEILFRYTESLPAYPQQKHRTERQRGEREEERETEIDLEIETETNRDKKREESSHLLNTNSLTHSSKGGVKQ